MSNDAYRGPGTVAQSYGEYDRFRFVFDQLANKMATCVPVVVKSVSGDRVGVQPAVHQVDGDGKIIPHGTINDCLVWQYRAGPAAVILAPVIGDMGLCLFAHSDISSVKANKGAAQPGSKRKFDYSDGIYLGGFFGAEPTVSITLDSTGVEIKGQVDTDTEYRVDGVRVVTNQQGAIASPTGGGTIDAQARVTLTQILAALRTHGLIAP